MSIDGKDSEAKASGEHKVGAMTFEPEPQEKARENPAAWRELSGYVLLLRMSYLSLFGRIGTASHPTPDESELPWDQGQCLTPMTVKSILAAWRQVDRETRLTYTIGKMQEIPLRCQDGDP